MWRNSDVRILYIAKHGSGDNDDEGAIAYAMEMLGHTVISVPEKSASSWMSSRTVDADFLLFHKWPELARFGLRVFPNSRYRDLPRVFWYFDLVDSTDPTLSLRAAHRVAWMKQVVPLCLVGFCTDGDWVKQESRGNLVHLMQGADERLVGPGMFRPTLHSPILFTGMIKHGQERENHIYHLVNRYGSQFKIHGNSPRERQHGRELADLLTSAFIVLAPNGPQSDRYWSNRIYLTLGFGGFLLHPACLMLEEHYAPGTEFIQYHDEHDCDDLIDHYLACPSSERLVVSHAGYRRTIKDHLYRHRCERLVEVVKARLR